MKIKALLFTFTICTLFLALESCQKCTETGTIDICTTSTGANAQYFSVTYISDTDTVIQTPPGLNYINSLYNLGNVRVSHSKSLAGPWLTIQEDFADGKFGPYYFTCPSQNTQIGVVYWDYYKIEKDTFGTDIWAINYALQSDECHTYWTTLKHIKNGTLEASTQGMEKADIVVTE